MTVKEIITKYLNDNGYDGLYNEDEYCACAIDDLCDCPSFGCKAGYKVPCDCGEHAYYMQEVKE